MVRFKNFDCTINVDGVALLEYTDPDDAGERKGAVPTAIVYIQSEEGKAFSIKLSVLNGVGINPNANAVSWSYELDAIKEGKGHVTKVGASGTISFNRFQAADGEWFHQDFHFSKLEVTEDAAERNDTKDSSALGEITIRICRYKTIGPSRTPKSVNHHAKAHGVKSVYEKELKGRDITHSVG
jgi:hypothetical protein